MRFLRYIWSRKGVKEQKLTDVDLQFLQVITDLIVYFSEGQTGDKQDHL